MSVKLREGQYVEKDFYVWAGSKEVVFEIRDSSGNPVDVNSVTAAVNDSDKQLTIRLNQNSDGDFYLKNVPRDLKFLVAATTEDNTAVNEVKVTQDDTIYLSLNPEIMENDGNNFDFRNCMTGWTAVNVNCNDSTGELSFLNEFSLRKKTRFNQINAINIFAELEIDNIPTDTYIYALITNFTKSENKVVYFDNKFELKDIVLTTNDIIASTGDIVEIEFGLRSRSNGNISFLNRAFSAFAQSAGAILRPKVVLDYSSVSISLAEKTGNGSWDELRAFSIPTNLESYFEDKNEIYWKYSISKNDFEKIYIPNQWNGKTLYVNGFGIYQQKGKGIAEIAFDDLSLDPIICPIPSVWPSPDISEIKPCIENSSGDYTLLKKYSYSDFSNSEVNLSRPLKFGFLISFSESYNESIRNSCLADNSLNCVYSKPIFKPFEKSRTYKILFRNNSLLDFIPNATNVESDSYRYGESRDNNSLNGFDDWLSNQTFSFMKKVLEGNVYRLAYNDISDKNGGKFLSINPDDDHIGHTLGQEIDIKTGSYPFNTFSAETFYELWEIFNIPESREIANVKLQYSGAEFKNYLNDRCLGRRRAFDVIKDDSKHRDHIHLSRLDYSLFGMPLLGNGSREDIKKFQQLFTFTDASIKFPTGSIKETQNLDVLIRETITDDVGLQKNKYTNIFNKTAYVEKLDEDSERFGITYSNSTNELVFDLLKLKKLNIFPSNLVFRSYLMNYDSNGFSDCRTIEFTPTICTDANGQQEVGQAHANGGGFVSSSSTVEESVFCFGPQFSRHF